MITTNRTSPGTLDTLQDEQGFRAARSSRIYHRCQEEPAFNPGAADIQDITLLIFNNRNHAEGWMPQSANSRALGIQDLVTGGNASAAYFPQSPGKSLSTSSLVYTLLTKPGQEWDPGKQCLQDRNNQAVMRDEECDGSWFEVFWSKKN